MLFTPLFLCVTLVAAQGAIQEPKKDPVLGELTSQGCFSSLPDGASSRQMTFASPGTCGNFCLQGKKAVAILQQDECYCADTYPTESSLVGDDKCDYPCPGYDRDACGGDKTYSVFNTGIKLNVEYDAGGSMSSASASASVSAAGSAIETSTASAVAPSTTSAAITSTSSDASSTIASDSASATEISTSSAASASTTPVSDASSTIASGAAEFTASSSTPTSGAHRISSPIGKFAKMIHVFFNK